MSEFDDAFCDRPEAAVCARAAAIRLLALDVDGVLTDGSVYIGGDGEPFKRFHIHDGKGLAMLREAGIATAIITARRSAAVTERARELGIDHLRLGVADKATALGEITDALELPLERCAYAGDDLVDLQPMARVGLAVAVANAHPRVRHRAHWITRRHGGKGAVREVCELLLAARGALAAVLDRHA